MVQYEVGKIKEGGMFSASHKVLFEMKYEQSTMDGDVSSISMKSDQGAELGKIQYAVKDKISKIQTFIIRDWSIENYAIAILKKLFEVLKRDSVKKVEGER